MISHSIHGTNGKFGYFWLIVMLNVDKFASLMDAMGIEWLFRITEHENDVYQTLRMKYMYTWNPKQPFFHGCLVKQPFF